MINVKAKIGDDTFEASGDFAFGAEFQILFDRWLGAVTDPTAEADIQIETLNDQTLALANAVTAATPPSPQP